MDDIDSQMFVDYAERDEEPILDISSDEDEDEDDVKAPPTANKMSDKVLPFNKRTYVVKPSVMNIPKIEPPASSEDNVYPPQQQLFIGEQQTIQTQWPAPDINTFRWLSMLSTTSNHMIVCHRSLNYVKNIRFGSSVYKEQYHHVFGHAYELHVNSVKLYVSATCLAYNKVPLELFPREEVQKIKDKTAISYLLNLKTDNDQTILTQLILIFHSINLLCLPTAQVDTINSILPSFVTHALLDRMRDNYNWKSEDLIIKKIKTPPAEVQRKQRSHLQILFRAFYNNGKFVQHRRENNFEHALYIKEFNNTLLSQNTAATDFVSHVKWLFSSIVKALYLNPPQHLFRLKPFDSTETEVMEFMHYSKLNTQCNALLHTKTPFTGKEHYRLNCFKINKVHVWVNSMIFNKCDTSTFNLHKILEASRWGIHHIIYFRYSHNQKLKQMHNETVKLIIRYIVTDRDLCKLANDVEVHPKIRYDYKCYECK